LDLFSHFGRIHVIAGVSPFADVSWNAYDYTGQQVSLEIV
jgi:hypothetical protein